MDDPPFCIVQHPPSTGIHHCAHCRKQVDRPWHVSMTGPITGTWENGPYCLDCAGAWLTAKQRGERIGYGLVEVT